MATPAISLNPNATTNAAGGFSTNTDGYIQGNALNDPAVRYQLSGGVLAAAETIPMWGGVGIAEAVPAGALGGNITRAANLAALTGFSVFDQNYAAINTPQSPVPLIGSGGMVNFYRFGTNARLAVACDPALVSLVNGSVKAQVSWDFTNQLLIAYDGANALPVKILDINVAGSMTVTWDAVNKVATWNRAGSVAIILL